MFFPSLREARSLLCRVIMREMMNRWMEKRIQEVTTGCIYISGAVEYDDRAASAVREQLVHSVTMWRDALMCAIRQSKDEGPLRQDTDPALMPFELDSFTLGLHHDACFLHLPEAVQLTRDALEKIFTSYQTAGSNGGAQTGAPTGASPAATTVASHHTDSR